MYLVRAKNSEEEKQEDASEEEQLEVLTESEDTVKTDQQSMC